MKKIISVITLIVMMGVNIMDPFTYATSSGDIFVETQEIDEIAVENGDFGENEEISDEEQDDEDDTDIDEDNETDEDSELDEDSDEETDEDIDDETEVGSGTQVEIDENEIEELTGDIEILSGDTVELAGEVVELTGDISELVGKDLELLIARETLDDGLIKKSASYNDVTVNVEAQPGNFPQGTELRITAVTGTKLNDVKDQVSNTDENISEESLVAFDISFIYVLNDGEEVEVQPKNGEGVKVVFNYENNKNLSEADTNDEQEIKVFHIDDKDENGEKVEKGDEVVKDVTNRVESDEEGIVVANAESFSIYAIVTTEENVSSLRVTHNLRGGYWMEDHSTASKIIEYTCSNGSCETTMHYRTPSKTGYMFIGWYDETLTNRRKDGVATDGMTVYAKWQEFGDLDVYIIENESNSGHYTLMDRNLGAKVIYNGNYSNPNEGSRGYYYQWGNNYGFDEYTTDNLPLSPIVSETKNVSSYSRSNPYYSSFFRGKEDQSIKNWMTSLNKKLWGDDGNNEVSRQGPCPDGYHIPTKAEYGNILSLYNKLINVSKEKLTRYLLMPPAGIRDRGYSALGKVFNSSYYRYITSSWNNTDFSNKAVWFFGADNDDVNNLKLDKEWSANGLSARCFMNNETLNDKYNIYLNGGEDAIITILSGVVQSFNVPYRNFYDFDGWYTSPNFEGDPIEVGSVLLPGSSLYAKWIRYDVYTITYNLNGGFMKFSNNTRESNLQEYAENTNNFTLNNPVKLNSVFVGRSGTNLSNPTLTVTIPRGSTGNRVYEALYECEPGYALDENNDCVGIRNADGTLNFDEWEYGTVDFVVGNTKITMLDRNLGATSNDINDAESQGFYYKWGNNYGFSLDHATKYGVTNERILNVTGYGPGTPSGYYTSPDWIYAGEKDQAGNWFINANFDLWGDVTDTLGARQGPCPNEYHIPSDNEVSSVINLLSEFANTSTGMQCISLYGNKRKCFQNLVKLPDSGYIKSNSSSSSSKTETNRIFLWTSSDYNNKSITAFHSTQSQSDMTTGERSSAAGMQVRCFKNINNVTVKYNFNGGYYGDNIYSKPDIEDDWYNLNKNYVSPLGLQMKRENSTFSGWYLDAEFTKPFTGGTLFPYVTQDTTFYAKFDCNEGYIPSQDGKSCTLEVFSSCELPWGGYAAHASSVTGYKENSETCPAQCSEVAQVATCNNGEWNVEGFTGTYVKSSCTTQEVTIPAEYTLNTCPLHGNCSSMTGYTVSNNACVLGEKKYRLDSCEAHYHTTGDNTQCEIDSFEITWSYKDAAGNETGDKTTVEYGVVPTHADPADYQTARTGYTFANWTPELTGAREATGYTAVYNETAREYTVSTGTNDNEQGSVTVETTAPYTYGKKITFKAHPKALHKLIRWEVNGEVYLSGGVVWTGDLEIELTGNLNVTGHFAAYSGCNWDGGIIAHGTSVTGYEAATVPFGEVCVSEIRTCNDGTLSGSYEYTGCEVAAPSSCELPWGGYAAHASSVTGYKENSETCPAQCSEVAQVATCNNGEWNVEGFTGTYVKSSCTTQEVTIPAEYTLNTCPLHGNCSSMTGYTVNNNACVLGNEKYRLDSCEAHYHTTGDNTQCEIDSFEITWKYMTEIGLQIETGNYAYGSMPSHAGNNYQTAQTGYIFNGWNPGVTSVTGPATYTAKYNETVRKYDIIWKYRDANGSRIEEIRKVEYGKNPEAPTLPSISQTAQTGYTFTGWNPEVSSPVTTGAEYTAQYEETLRTYLIAWQDYDGSMISWSLYNYGDRLIIPADPTRPEDENNIYEFIGWSPNVSEFVTGNRFYKAQYEAYSKKTPSGGGGSSSGGGGRRMPYIPDKDIDDITEKEQSKIHGSAEENNAENREIQVPLITKQNMRKYSKQVIDSYIWAFDNNITTINEFDKANPDGTITRGLLAKMVVNYTRNILGKEIPLDTPTKCNWKDDTKEWKSQEIKFYAEKACALGIMGIKTNKFEPNKIVSRAEFGTILSRILWGDKYDVRNPNKNNPYYVNHLKVLKENGIMNDIDNPLGRKELRKWIWVMFRRTESLNRKRVGI